MYKLKTNHNVKIISYGTIESFIYYLVLIILTQSSLLRLNRPSIVKLGIVGGEGRAQLQLNQLL